MYIHQIYLYLFIFKHNSFERCFLPNGVILVNECIVFNGHNWFCDVHCISYIYFLVCLIISLCMMLLFFDGITIASPTFVVSVKGVWFLILFTEPGSIWRPKILIREHVLTPPIRFFSFGHCPIAFGTFVSKPIKQVTTNLWPEVYLGFNSGWLSTSLGLFRST